MRRRLAPALAAVLAVSLAAAKLGAPYDPAEQHRMYPYAAPMSLHWSDESGGLHANPYYCVLQADKGWQGAKEDCSQKMHLRWLTGWRLFQADSARPFFLLGSDEFGRDQLSRIVEGGRMTLTAGLAAAGLAILLGLGIGTLAGYRGGWNDEVLMGATTVFLSCPWIYLLLGIRAFLPLSVPPERAFVIFLVVAALVGWARPARVFRGVVQSTREREYVAAARAFGATEWHIFRFHLIPELKHVVLAQFVVLAPRFVMAEVTLSFVGLGINEPGVSWGTMLSSLRDISVLSSYSWMALPCVPVAMTFVLFQWAGRRATS